MDTSCFVYSPGRARALQRLTRHSPLCKVFLGSLTRSSLQGNTKKILFTGKYEKTHIKNKIYGPIPIAHLIFTGQLTCGVSIVDSKRRTKQGMLGIILLPTSALKNKWVVLSICANTRLYLLSSSFELLLSKREPNFRHSHCQGSLRVPRKHHPRRKLSLKWPSTCGSVLVFWGYPLKPGSKGNQKKAQAMFGASLGETPM